MDFSDDQIDRYSRQLILMDVGGTGQIKLLNSRVAVVGAGGLGAPALAYLAAAGVGHITLIDPDVIELSNLQRQITYGLDDIGKPKVEAAAAFIRARNDDIKVTSHHVALAADRAHLLAGHDLILDCSDNFPTRFLVNESSIRYRIPLISAALGSWEGQLASFTPWAGDLPCYQCLVPDMPPEDVQRTCSDRGIMGTVAGMIGLMQAQEAVKHLLNIGDRLAGKLLIQDTLGARQRLVTLPRDPHCPACSQLERPA